MATRIRTEPVETLLNRELSHLEFHARVLELATDESLPLLERVNYCWIFSSNLDEFFQVRVAGLLGQAEAGLVLRSADGLTPQQALARIRERVLELSSIQSKLWKKELRPALDHQGIVVGGIEDLSSKELEKLEKRFHREIYPVLTPLAVGPGQPFPYISGLSLSLAIFAEDPDTGEARFARVKIPEGLPRFFKLGGREVYVPLEQIIAHFLPALFPGVEILERAVFRVTRDADFEVSDDGDDLLEAVETQLRRRRFGDVVRVEVSSSASSEMVARLQGGLEADETQIYRVDGLLDLSELVELVRLDRPDLKFDAWIPAIPPRFAAAQTDLPQVFDEIRRGDILVHQPYGSFRASFEVFAQAAVRDPSVIAMKTAVYRTSDDSVLVGSLIQCAEDGKQSVCLVELKARFDELRNIEWSRALEQAGVHVAYGFPDLKIHAKMTLIVRREGDLLRRYAHIGTGNYHAATARLYEDLGVFTADEEITADVADLFNYITGFARPQTFRKLLVAPFTLRSGLVDEIRGVADAAAHKKHARIRLKLNHLVDPGIVAELYAASQAGAQVDIVARSTCALRPGVDDLSENIHVRSIVGRFLEHSRIYSFEADERVATYIGSPDLMQRNLDHRIEVLVPVENQRVRAEIHAILDSALADNLNAWILSPSGEWERATPGKSDKPHSHHDTMMLRSLKRARRVARDRRAP
ncbi:MAG TPA: polyphosphate kinase 1 [Gaiellaceae bacterium]|nr:polyphosphate kinase 1 [Gaiellaceae bacterium]